jgi:hypothetical protein
VSAPPRTSAAGHSSGRPGGGNTPVESMLSFSSGAGPDCTGEVMPRPVRFDDPKRDAAYWARIRRIVDAAPPLDDSQRAAIRAAFHGSQQREAA